ncbi:DNA-directed RNA polymerase subunit beta, partial [Patescibacteria group bacterium]|nr:DNA-directed RNA polymerase subunit beta [Patescibacteria group bacterium]
MAKNKRIYWGKSLLTPSPVDLLSVQKESWQWFLEEGLEKTIRSVSPIVDYTGDNWHLDLGKIVIEEAVITPREAQRKGLSYAAPVKIEAALTNKRTGEKVTEDVFLLNLPLMTEEGTFIISGIERGIINQLIRSPGAYFTGEEDPATGKTLYRAEIRPVRGSWLEFFTSRRGVLYARVDRRRKFPATIILRAVGVEKNDLLIKTFSGFIKPTIEMDSSRSREEAILEFYRKMRPGEPAVFDTAENFFRERFFSLKTYELGQVGRYKMNKRLGVSFPDDDEDNWVLRKEDLISAIKYLIALQRGEETKVDDIDHLGNRRLRRIGEILTQIALRQATARFERMVKERMSLVSPKEKASPAQMINSQSFANSINSFFRTNQLSAILDQTNPLSELDLLRRVTVIGPGGLTRERASFSIRDIHGSQYGRVCPVRSPEGINIGLVTYLALFARVNQYGFLEAPYRVVKKVKIGKRTRMKVTDEVVYLSADDEEDRYITHLGIKINSQGYLEEKWVPVRYGGDFFEASASKVELIDYVSQEVVGTSASLIPFIAHDEPQRALMGSHMQCQAVPLVNPQSPIVGTGMESVIAESMGRVIRAEESGKVICVDSKRIVIQPKDKNKKKKIYHLTKFKRTSPYGTCYNQKPMVSVGDSVGKGTLLADGPATENGELALGRNLTIAYCQFEGLVYEDAIVISDKLIEDDVFTSITINEYEAQIVDTKLGPEEITRDIPNVAEPDLSKLTQEGIVMIGAKVGPNDILVGKVEPKGEKELSAEERLLRAIFGDKAREVKDTSLKVPHGEGGIVIDINILDREKGDELDPGVNKVVKVTVAQLRRIKEGDKLAGRHGNKGVVSRIVPQEDMPYLEDGTPVDIIISPLSVIARMNLGQILEMHLGWAGEKLGQKYALPVFERVPEEFFQELLQKAGLPVSGKKRLFNGRTGQPYDQEVAIGCAYIMKLTHMVDDKVHARSTGPYSLVTQQPLGGKARMGGQRLGEMEVWALEA